MSDNLGRQQRLCLPKSAPRPDPRSFAQSSPEIRDLRLRQIATLKRLTGFATSRIVPRIYKDSAFGYGDEDVYEELNEGAIRLVEHTGGHIGRAQEYLVRAIEERAAGREGVTVVKDDFHRACELLCSDQGYEKRQKEQQESEQKDPRLDPYHVGYQVGHEHGCQFGRKEGYVAGFNAALGAVQGAADAGTSDSPAGARDGERMEVGQTQHDSFPQSSSGSGTPSDHAMSDTSTVTSSPELLPAAAAAAQSVPDLSLSDAATTTSAAAPAGNLHSSPGQSRKNKRSADEMDVDEPRHYGGNKKARK